MEPTTDIPHCTGRDICKLSGRDAEAFYKSLDEYLEQFAQPIRKENGGDFTGHLKCLKCGKSLDGILGTFQWGIVHGEGNCSYCGWPCRACHRPKHEGEEIFNRALQMILQYHPDYVVKK